MATTVKLTTVTSPSVAVKAEDYTVPTESGAGVYEDFCASIEAPDGRGFFVINNEDGSADVGVSLVAGDYVGATDTTPVTVAKGDIAYLFADSALCKAEGKLWVRLTPAASTALSTCGIKIGAVQFMPTVNH